MNEEQVSVVRRRRSRQEVKQLVAEYESSGLSRSEFCRERGLGLSTLDRYRTQQKRQASAGRNAFVAVEVSGRALVPGAGLADSGTRLLVQVSDVPAGVDVYAAVSSSDGISAHSPRCSR